MASICPRPSSPWHLEEAAFSAFPSHPASSGLFPTLLSAASSPFPVPALFPFPSLSAVAPSHGDLAPSLCLGAAPEGHDRVHAPVEINEISFLAEKKMPHTDKSS